MRKTSDKSKTGKILLTDSTHQKCQNHERQGKTEELSQIEGDEKDTTKCNELDAATEKKHQGEIQIKSVVNSILPKLISWL